MFEVWGSTATPPGMWRILLGEAGSEPWAGLKAQRRVGLAGFLIPAFPPCFATSQNPKVRGKGFGPGVCLFILGQSPEGQLGVKVEITGD